MVGSRILMHLVASNHLLSSWRVELGSGGLDEVSQVLVKGIAAATSACPFNSTVMVSPSRDVCILPVLAHVRVDGSRNEAKPFVSSIG